jgi:3-keto-L-gulonate-6-phosphate decarboxylase
MFFIVSVHMVAEDDGVALMKMEVPQSLRISDLKTHDAGAVTVVLNSKHHSFSG